jgi:glycosyltransferase involved in cell wall biosynthesis
MNLLICTQVVDRKHSNLALAHEWIAEFAKHCESVSVICLYEGEHALPSNVRVYSLGKERRPRSSIRYALRFWHLLWELRGSYDTVFVHMNPEYVLLGSVFWRITGKKIALWYTHKSVTLKLRVAVLLASVVFSASSESFRIATRKLRIVGHGIDTVLFASRPRQPKGLRIVTVGRISKSKRVLEILDALDVLYARHVPFHFTIVGGPIFAHDIAYEAQVQSAITNRPYASKISIMGVVPYQQLPDLLSAESVFINLSETGSIDRAVLEAISIGLVPVTSNEAFKAMLSPYGLYVSSNNPEKIADAIEHAQHQNTEVLQERIAIEHSLPGLVSRIVALLS